MRGIALVIAAAAILLAVTLWPESAATPTPTPTPRDRPHSLPAAATTPRTHPSTDGLTSRPGQDPDPEVLLAQPSAQPGKLDLVTTRGEPIRSRGIGVRGKKSSLPLAPDGNAKVTLRDGSYELSVPVWRYTSPLEPLTRRRYPTTLLVADGRSTSPPLSIDSNVVSVVLRGVGGFQVSTLVRVWTADSPGPWTAMIGGRSVHAMTICNLPEHGTLEVLSVEFRSSLERCQSAHQRIDLSSLRPAPLFLDRATVTQLGVVQLRKDGELVRSGDVVVTIGRQSIGAPRWHRRVTSFGEVDERPSVERVLSRIDGDQIKLTAGPWPKDSWLVTPNAAISVGRVIEQLAAFEGDAPAIVDMPEGNVIFGRRNLVEGTIRLELATGEVLTCEDLSGGYCFPIANSKELPATMFLPTGATIDVEECRRFDL